MIPMQMVKDVAEQHVADLLSWQSRRPERPAPPPRSGRARPTGTRQHHGYLLRWRLRTAPALGCVPDQA
jgi:hypothetical protein